MKYLLYGTVGVLVIFIGLNSFGFNSFVILMDTIEWSTRYILPWIALYWFIQYVKRKK
ncbi:hypothetical protein [Evansella cellulosilytica]|uniref:Uncharacterized protein n=1 Tax=Evansella cellulosilytica (strain ATCC 21833 / DSM 2522 / FERM P-1141 / JCM 9156 / N-4) TaxID=649639 RepID=E6U1G4_EVAC2|nr:hypothetical protein [Evansella cellulosilytica]ADU29211.1 hypothetical protein Bcell_0935 [Evansella cellulosilytica DSM 2522]